MSSSGEKKITSQEVVKLAGYNSDTFLYTVLSLALALLLSSHNKQTLIINNNPIAMLYSISFRFIDSINKNNSGGPVRPSVLDLRIAHERFGSSSEPSIHGHLQYPNDIDRSLNEVTSDKIRKYL